MKGYIIGPMPAQNFLDDFFPTKELPNLETVPSFEENCYADTVSAKSESTAYVPFVSHFYNLKLSTAFHKLFSG